VRRQLTVVPSSDKISPGQKGRNYFVPQTPIAQSGPRLSCRRKGVEERSPARRTRWLGNAISREILHVTNEIMWKMKHCVLTKENEVVVFENRNLAEGMFSEMRLGLLSHQFV
jgi:hypothetical protein